MSITKSKKSKAKPKTTAQRNAELLALAGSRVYKPTTPEPQHNGDTLNLVTLGLQPTLERCITPFLDGRVADVQEVLDVLWNMGYQSSSSDMYKYVSTKLANMVRRGLLIRVQPGRYTTAK